MKFNNLIPLIILLGITTLFFFPEPETNFIAYITTALIFVIIIIALTIWKKKK